MTARRPVIAGNWKMNTMTATARELAAAIAGGLPEGHESLEVVVAPPFPYLIVVRDVLAGTPVKWGAQNVWHEPPGAYTGEVAVEMLNDLECTHVILGHSERRHVLGETDELINRKIKAALAGGLTVILCVGELLSEREKGETHAVLDRQLQGGLQDIRDDEMERIILAYEPVWAIGTGKTATPQQAQEAHNHLRNRLQERYNAETAESVRILYGGSVKPDNAASLLQCPDIDGALVGGASLKAETFLPIVEAGVSAKG